VRPHTVRCPRLALGDGAATPVANHNRRFGFNPDTCCAIQTFPSVSFHRCHCVSVKCVARMLSVLEARVSVCRGESLRRWRGERFGRYRCLTLRYSLLLSVWVGLSAEHKGRYPFHFFAQAPRFFFLSFITYSSHHKAERMAEESPRRPRRRRVARRPEEASREKKNPAAAGIERFIFFFFLLGRTLPITTQYERQTILVKP